MAKKLSKILWYGADKDALGKPIIPPLSPSIEKHLEGLNEGEIYIHNDDEYPALYIRTNKDKIVAIGGAEALMKYFLRKDQPDTAREVITFEKGLNVGEFVSGASGASFFKDLTTGQTIMELDKLYVRMKAFFETLTIVEAQTISGKQIISPAGSVRCTNVEEYDDYYRCYFLNEQDGEKIENKFIEGDQVYSQMFNAKTGTSNNISNRYYWRLVTGVGENYIDLSKTDCDADSDAPMVGDVLNQRGHRYPENSERMNFIETSTVDGFSPSITLFHGVNSFSLAGKDYVQFGVDKTTNKAFMNVYGDMYVGDRNKTAYMRYTQEEGLVICGKLDVGTKLGDSYLKDLIAASTPEGYQEFVEKVTQDLEGLQAQIDGTIDSYFFQYEPSLDNYPASEWDTEDEKKAHLNDTFTNLVDGRSWRWSLDGTYKWVEITDTATTKALELAGKAKDTADGKRRVFVVTDEHPTPYPPYDKGDLWSRGSDYPLLICVVPKESGVYAEGDFDYADNNAKLKEEMQALVTDTKSELNNSIGQAKEAANKYADEGIASAKEDINASIAELEEAKANVTEVYSKSEADGKITEAETSAINAAKVQADAAIALSEATIKAYADGIVDDEEAARIKQAQENLAEAKRYAEEQAEAAKSEIENSYLFQALQDAQSTEIENGLVLTSLIQLRDTQSNIMSGINGLINASKGDKSIATWWGGDMLDLIDYYRWDGTQWVVKSGLTAPSNIPSGLIRMDGTGYLAKGKFWWDNDGKIYADPTALFLSFDVENEGASLSATILDIRDKQTEFANMWSIETDSNGTKYLYSKYPLVSQGGVTMYAGTSGLDVEGIYDGLPIDGSTIYWENGVLKAVGGGGVADSVAWADITGKPYFATVATSGSYNDLLNKPTLLSSFTNDLGFVTESALSGKYLPLSGGTITGNLQIGSSTNTSFNNLLLVRNASAVRINNTGSAAYFVFGDFNSSTFTAQKSIEIGDYELRYSSDGGTNYNTILHSGNYSSYALPITGGTISGSGASLFTINRTDNQYVTTIYKYNGTELGKIGFAGSNNPSYWDVSQSTWRTFLHAGNYSSYALPLTGGTLTGRLAIKYSLALVMDTDLSNAKGISWKNAGDTAVIGSIYYHNTEQNFIINPTGASDTWSDALGKYSLVIGNNKLTYNTYTIYHSGNLTKLSQLTNDSGFITSSASISGNAATATKLATARTIWGQSFDGTGNVDGTLRVNAVSGSYTQGIRVYQNGSGYANLILGSRTLTAKVGTDSNTWCLTTNSNADFVVSRGGYQLTDTISFGYNGNWLINGGNVGIGTVTPEYKLDVNGTAKVGNNVANGVLLKFNMDRAWHFYQEGSGATSALVLQSATSGKYFHIKNDSGSNIASFFASSESGNRVSVDGIFGATTIYQNGTSLDTLLGAKLNSSSYTAADVLAKLKTVDGSGSGLDADTLDGYQPSSLNVGSATKLKTARTIWGQSFDGTGNVSGDISLGSGVIRSNNGQGMLSSNGYVLIGYETSANGNRTYIDGNDIYLRYGTTHANGLVMDSSGKVGIGTTSPSYRLHVAGSIYSSSYVKTSSYVQVGNSYYDNGAIELYGDTPFIDFHHKSSTADYTTRLIEGLSGQLTCTGKFRIGLGYTTSTDYNFYVSGSAYISSNLLTGGGITMYSARVLKNVVDERGLSLRELSIIKPTRYTWKDKRDERLHIGGIADDIQQVLPEVVYRTPDGVLTMDYGNAAFAIASSLIKPMIEHESEIVSLKRRVRELEEEVKRLRA